MSPTLEEFPQGANPIWGMLGARLPKGVLGLSDPDVHEIDGRWVMFIGGFSRSFRNRLYRAMLPTGDAPDQGWVLDRSPIVADAPRGGWDAGGMHTPNYLPAGRDHPARVYYAGRAGSRHYGEGSTYAIGVLARRGDGLWERRDEPVVRGWPGRASALEPRVIRVDGGYRMWFLATPHEVGPGEQPDFELRVTDSEDGLRWDPPRAFATPAEGFFDNAVYRTSSGWEMVLARGTNLHGTVPFPEQGLWAMRSQTPSADRADWSAPRRILDTDAPGTPPWMGRGVCGPSVVMRPDGRRLVFLTGTHGARSWRQAARLRFAHHGRLPVPAPYWLTTGTVSLPR